MSKTPWSVTVYRSSVHGCWITKPLLGLSLGRIIKSSSGAMTPLAPLN